MDLHLGRVNMEGFCPLELVRIVSLEHRWNLVLARCRWLANRVVGVLGSGRYAWLKLLFTTLT